MGSKHESSMLNKPLILGFTLVALAVAYIELRLPGPVEAQGGDAVYRSIRTQIPIARAYLEPQGLQDAAYDFLISDMGFTSDTYGTVLSASVTVGESGDAVLVHVVGRFRAGSEIGAPPALCMIRLARGTTEIELVELRYGEILFDTTFVDSPPVGTHVYSLQARRMTGVCSVSHGLGTVPLPSLLVQSFYAGSIP